MYRQSKSFISKLFLIQTLSAALVFALPFCAAAQASKSLDPSKEVVVKYIGTENDMIVFAVQFANETGSKCNVSISNTAGEVLFRDIFQVKYFDKKFKVPKEHRSLELVIANTTDKVTRNISIDHVVAFVVANPEK